MAPNKRKILEAARKYAQKGNKDRALKEYEKLLKLDPRDAKLRLEIGDAHRRWGQVDAAVAAYNKVADQYMNEGFDARAVAVYKQIQSLDSDRFESYVPLADLYQRMGLASEAIQALQTAADGFHKQGKKRDALGLLRKMATLDPSNTTSRIKVADLLRREGMEAEAIDEYEAAHEELERQGEQEAAATVLERVLEIDGKRVPMLVALTKNLLGRGQAESAEPYAKQALELETGEVGHYEMLADIYRAQQRDEEMADVYRRLADLYRERGDDQKAREIIQRFAPPEFSAPIEPDTGDAAAVENPEPTLLEDELLDDGEALVAEELSLDDEVQDVADEPLLDLDEVVPVSAEPAAEPEFEMDLEPIEGDPEQLLAEASVYLRYGKRAQAIRNLEAILARKPDHRGALEKLGDAHAEAEDAPAAVSAWQRAAECARSSNDLSGFGVLRDRIAALDLAAAEALGAAPEPAADEAQGADPEEDLIDLDAEAPAGVNFAPADVGDEFDLEDDIEIDLDEDPPADEGNAVSTLQEAAAVADAGASAVAKQKLQEELDEAEFYHQQGLLDEAKAIYERVLEAAPNHPLAMVRMGEIEAQQGGEGAAPQAETSPAREEPPTLAEDPALDADIDIDIDVEIEEDAGEWTDDGLDDDELEFDGEAAKQPDTVEIEVELPDVELDASGPDVAESLTDSADDANASTANIELPDVGPDAPEVEVAEPPPGVTDTPDAIDAPDAVEAPIAIGAPDERDSQVPVAIDVPDEVVAEALAADTPGESFDDLVIEANAGDERESAGDSFDLAAELADALDGDSSGASSTGGLASANEQEVFSAVFSEFKKGVDKALGEGDHEARYDLGIAYREMGLLDDAVREFQAASMSPARRLDCLQMLGLCAIDMGRAEEATTHLQQALATPKLSQVQTLGLRFELGRAFEVLEDLEKAREAWEAVAAVDPSFCEVEERLASLGQAKSEPDAGDLESFDDLFDDEDDDQDTGSVEAGASSGESFDDLIEEANADDAAPDDAAIDAAEDTDDLSSDAVAPEPADAAEEKKPRRRKKKISFV